MIHVLMRPVVYHRVRAERWARWPLLVVLLAAIGCAPVGRAAVGIAQPAAASWQFVAGESNKPGEFRAPAGIALDDQGNVYVADQRNHRVQILSPTGQPLAQWGSRGSAPGQFEAPAGVALDRQGNVYVADTGNHRVQKLSPTGEPLAQWGARLGWPGALNEPTAVAIDASGYIYVADTNNCRVLKLSPAGRPLAQWETPSHIKQYTGPTGMAVDDQGTIYVADSVEETIRVYGSDGRLHMKWSIHGDPSRRPSNRWSSYLGLAIDRDGTFLVTLGNEHRIHRLSPDGRLLAQWGTLGEEAGAFSTPRGVAVDRQGRILVADSGNNRVQIFAPDGQPAAQWAGSSR
jgi:tripartite motif-containing protein 71